MNTYLETSVATDYKAGQAVEFEAGDLLIINHSDGDYNQLFAVQIEGLYILAEIDSDKKWSPPASKEQIQLEFAFAMMLGVIDSVEVYPNNALTITTEDLD